MPTYAQLQAESYWTREIVTDEIDWLGDELCRRTNRPRAAFGSKGDNAHLRGAHRSQEWLLKSRYSTSRTYTVQSGLTAEQARHVAGIDFTPGSDTQMIAQCKRLLAAMKAGQLNEVVEFYGNVNGDKIVDGWDNPRDRPASSDSSHLWHWHLTIDRRHCRNRKLMERILAIALGLTLEDDDMDATERAALMEIRDNIRLYNSGMSKTATGTVLSPTVWRIRDEEWQAKVTSLLTALSAQIGGLDTKQVIARIEALAAEERTRDAELAELVRAAQSGELAADQFVDEVARRLADQG
ncbi:hypothetical protein ACIBEF_00465 [Micromonospora sp. NPDC050795]|uniref:hypothetical protein n=1 Tax=Micromonospora sp. NPDC050795 TaxID=3364282 RepID=UPI0037B6561D